jgi:hypothetical protein
MKVGISRLWTLGRGERAEEVFAQSKLGLVLLLAEANGNRFIRTD